jgi:hypothetical protein
MARVAAGLLAAVATVAASDGADAPPDQLFVATSNALIASSRLAGEAWVESPVLIAANLFGPSPYSKGRMRYLLEFVQTQPDGGVATIEVDGLLDDSISGERRAITFRLRGGKWSIAGIDFSVKCQPGRGHGEFAQEPCE